MRVNSKVAPSLTCYGFWQKLLKLPPHQSLVCKVRVIIVHGMYITCLEEQLTHSPQIILSFKISYFSYFLEQISIRILIGRELSLQTRFMSWILPERPSVGTQTLQTSLTPFSHPNSSRPPGPAPIHSFRKVSLNTPDSELSPSSESSLNHWEPKL